MSSKPVETAGASAPIGVVIERAGDVLNFTLNNSEHENEVTGAMFDAMLAELRREAAHPERARLAPARARQSFLHGARARGAGRRDDPSRIRAAHRIQARLASFAADQRRGSAGRRVRLRFRPRDRVRFRLRRRKRGPGISRDEIRPRAGRDHGLPRRVRAAALRVSSRACSAIPIAPQQAQQIGLISHVSPASTLASDVDAVIERILRLDPNAARNCKEFFQTAQQNSFDQNCRLATEALTVGSLAVLSRQK